MKKLLILLVGLCVVFVNVISGQTEEDLGELVKPDSAYSHFVLSNPIQVPMAISIRTIGEIRYFTKCINGSVAVLPVSLSETDKSRILLKKYTELNNTYSIDPESQIQMLIVLN